jgi:hypothetical protein
MCLFSVSGEEGCRVGIIVGTSTGDLPRATTKQKWATALMLVGIFAA